MESSRISFKAFQTMLDKLCMISVIVAYHILLKHWNQTMWLH